MLLLPLFVALACSPGGGEGGEVRPLEQVARGFHGVSLVARAEAGEVSVEAAHVDPGDGERATASDVEVSVSGASELNISAARSTWELATHRATFEGGVEVAHGGFTLSCEGLVVQHTPEGEVVSAEASGGVVVSREGLRAEGRVATLDLREGAVVIEGGAVITQGPSRVEGERVLLHMTDERVECEGCRMVVGDFSLERD